MGGIGDLRGGNVPSSANLPQIKPEQRLTPAFFGKVINGIDRATLRSGNGYIVTNHGNGQTITIPQQTRAAVSLNFQVYAFLEKDIPKATISLGTVNRVIPKINTKYLDEYEDGIPPKLTISGNTGYVILEVEYDANKPFPSEANIKWVSDRPSTASETTKSTFILATTLYSPKTNEKAATITTTQVHKKGNLIVNRFKIGSSNYYWYWYTV